MSGGVPRDRPTSACFVVVGCRWNVRRDTGDSRDSRRGSAVWRGTSLVLRLDGVARRHSIVVRCSRSRGRASVPSGSQLRARLPPSTPGSTRASRSRFPIVIAVRSGPRVRASAERERGAAVRTRDRVAGRSPPRLENGALTGGEMTFAYRGRQESRRVRREKSVSWSKRRRGAPRDAGARRLWHGCAGSGVPWHDPSIVTRGAASRSARDSATRDGRRS